jgi:hypothetical protein
MRRFIAYALTEETPDHSTISRTRRLYSVETHKAVFRWVLKILVEEGLVVGKTVSIDATTLEANAALRSLVRRDNGQKYDDYLKGLAKAAGIENPTREQLARLDRKRKKKGSNQEWKNPHDPDSRITKMKDGSTHLAHKAEHAVDLSSGALLAVTVQGADQGDTTTIHQTLAEAGETVEELIEHEATTTPGRESKRRLPTRAITAEQCCRTCIRWAVAATSRNRIEVNATGKAKRLSRNRCTPTGGASWESAASDCSGSVAN